MQIEVFLRRAQEVQESVMIDRLQVSKPGELVYDRDKMAKVQQPPSILWDGPGLVQAVKAQATSLSVGGQQVISQPYRGKLPIEVEVEAGLTVTVLESIDPWLVGRSFIVGVVYGSSMATCRYFELEDRGQ